VQHIVNVRVLTNNVNVCVYTHVYIHIVNICVYTHIICDVYMGKCNTLKICVYIHIHIQNLKFEKCISIHTYTYSNCQRMCTYIYIYKRVP